MNTQLAQVSAEQAAKLKSLGFYWKTNSYFWDCSEDSSGALIIDEERDECNWNVNEEYYSAPTLALAAQWLREKGFHVHVEVCPDFIKWYPRVTEEGMGYEKFAYHGDHDAALSFSITFVLTVLKERA